MIKTRDYDIELMCAKEQIAVADLYDIALSLSWKNPIKKIKAIIIASKAEKEFYRKYPKMKEGN